ncbi:MAG: glycosyltransferase family 4 protein [Deltaproteobacteria bacterium]|nr:glycosyltransferase family 4 protein [Deltaproteobacteria bacterium]
MTVSGKRRKVLMLTLFPTSGNGSSTVVFDLATALSRDLEVHVFYIDLEETEIAGYHSHFYVTDDFPVLRTHPKSKAGRRFIDLSIDEVDDYLARITAAVKGIVAEVEPDFIHVHHGWLGATVANRLQDDFPIPYAVQFHGTEIEIRSDYREENAEVFEHLDRLVTEGLRGATSLVTISPTEEEKTRAFLETAAVDVPVTMIPNGYDEDIFTPAAADFEALNQKFADRLGGKRLDPERPIVLFVGRFASFKGIQHLVRAAPDYASTGAQTILCGDGELREEMESLSSELGLADCHFFGHVDHFDDLPDLYRAADVLVVPSEGEPFGLVAIEALGCGTPVIGSDSGALPYILSATGERKNHGDFDLTGWGMLVPFGNPAAIAEAVRFATASELKAKSGARIAGEVKDMFSLSRQVSRFRQLFDRIAQAS